MRDMKIVNIHGWFGEVSFKEPASLFEIELCIKNQLKFVNGGGNE